MSSKRVKAWEFFTFKYLEWAGRKKIVNRSYWVKGENKSFWERSGNWMFSLIRWGWVVAPQQWSDKSSMDRACQPAAKPLARALPAGSRPVCLCTLMTFKGAAVPATIITTCLFYLHFRDMNYIYWLISCFFNLFVGANTTCPCLTLTMRKG